SEHVEIAAIGDHTGGSAPAAHSLGVDVQGQPMPIEFDVKREKSTVRGGRLDDSARTTPIGTMRPSAMYTNGGITCSDLERRSSRVCHCVTKTRIQGQDQSLTTELRR